MIGYLVFDQSIRNKRVKYIYLTPTPRRNMQSGNGRRKGENSKIMKTTSEQLIDQLETLTDRHISIIQDLQKSDPVILHQKPDPQAWNALECIEHLNLYGNFYLKEIHEALETRPLPLPGKTYKSGWLGNYFAKAMWPDEKSKKTKTFKQMDPTGNELDTAVLKEFEQQQFQMKELLEKSRKTDLMKIKIPLTISRWIRLRLGDVFRMVIYHNERHIRQAIRATSPYQSPQ